MTAVASSPRAPATMGRSRSGYATATVGTGVTVRREKKCGAGFHPAKVLLTQKRLSSPKWGGAAGVAFFSTDRGFLVENEWLELTSQLINQPIDKGLTF